MTEPSFWLGLAALVVASGCVFTNSVLWFERSWHGSGAEWLLCLATLVCAQIIVIVAGLGLAGALSVTTIVAVPAIVTALGVIRLGWRGAQADLAKAALRWQQETSRAKALVSEAAVWPAWLGVGVALLALGARALSQPPLTFDDLMYHLAYPADWMRSGRLDTPHVAWCVPTIPYYGLNSELMYFWLLAPLRSDVLAKVAQLPAMLLLSLAVYTASRTLGAGRRESALVAFLPWSNPSLVTEAFFNVNDDLWAACFLLVSVVLSLKVWQGRRAWPSWPPGAGAPICSSWAPQCRAWPSARHSAGSAPPPTAPMPAWSCPSPGAGRRTCATSTG